MDQPDDTIDFSDIPEITEIPPDAVRGKFHKPDSARQVPVFLSLELQSYLLEIAQRKGISLSDLVNDILGKEIAIAEVIHK